MGGRLDLPESWAPDGWQPAAPDDPGGRGILAPLPAPRASPRLPAYPPLRLSRSPAAHGSLASWLPVPGAADRLAIRIRTAARAGRRLLDPTAFHFHLALPPLRRPHDYPGATNRGGNVSALSTPRPHEARMKYSIPVRPHCARSPRPRSRVPDHMAATDPSSPYPLIRSPRDLRLTDNTSFLTRRQPFHLSLYPPAAPLTPVQNP